MAETNSEIGRLLVGFKESARKIIRVYAQEYDTQEGLNLMFSRYSVLSEMMNIALNEAAMDFILDEPDFTKCRECEHFERENGEHGTCCLKADLTEENWFCESAEKRRD